MVGGGGVGAWVSGTRDWGRRLSWNGGDSVKDETGRVPSQLREATRELVRQTLDGEK